MIGKHVSILDWQNSKYFFDQLNELNFFVSCQLYGRKFIRIVEIENFWKQKAKVKNEKKNELIKIN